MHNEVRVGNLPRLLLDPEWLNALADEYLAALPNTVPTAANADYYASIVYEKSQLRNLISAGTQVVELGYSATDPADQLIAQAEAAIYAVGTGRTNAALHANASVVMFSLEMSWAAIMERVWAAHVPMPTQVLRTGFLTEAHWKGIAHASGPLSEMLVSLNDSSTISVLEMRAQARRLKADGACKLVVIDHLQMIQPRTRHENRTQELSGIIRDVKSMAKELDVPVIVVSQLSRAAEMSGAARPQLRHLRDSGELEQVADVVLFLYREEYHDPEAAQQHNTENLCEVIIAKNRNGALKTVKLFFDREHARFTNLEDHREE